MPDGFRITEAISALERDDAGTIPVIAMTADAFDEDVQRPLHAGMNAHLNMPVEPDTLSETVSEHMGSIDAAWGTGISEVLIQDGKEN